jgi:hypothetical protein
VCLEDKSGKPFSTDGYQNLKSHMKTKHHAKDVKLQEVAESDFDLQSIQGKKIMALGVE